MFVATDEERLNKAIDEIRTAEAEKRENMADSESEKLIEMEANLDSLKAVSAI